MRDQFLHVIDIAPTIYEVTGVTPPTVLNGVPQKPIEGISFAYTFDDAKTKGRRTKQYFEMGVNRGIYQDGWMASAPVLSALAVRSRRVRPGQTEVGALPHRRGFQPSQRHRGGQSARSCASCRISGGRKPHGTMFYR